VFAAAAATLPAHAAGGEDVAGLKALEHGRWELRDLDTRRPRQQVCVRDSVQLAQVEHAGGSCPAEVVESDANGATIQYSCSGRGFGHSHLRVETPRLVRIDTQGISNGRPFSLRIEARRIGRC
jgi:hypothetical protein